jgi:hypothetical protein
MARSVGYGLFVSLAIFISVLLVLAFVLLSFLNPIRRFDRSTDPSCGFPPPIHSFSSVRNAVFLYATTDYAGTILAIRSLRTVDPLCRIILFVPRSFRISFPYHDSLLESGVEFFSLLQSGSLSDIPHLIRFDLELLWLDEHISEVDKVFHCDSTDSFFQASPFPSLSDDGITFVGEGRLIGQCPWNSAWLEKCYGDAGVQFQNREILCSGSIGGNASVYQTFLTTLRSGSDWQKCQFRSADQPILNHYVWSGQMNRSGLKYEIRRCEHGFFTMTWCNSSRLTYSKEGLLLGEGEDPLIFIHQYNRVAGFVDRFAKACHIPV